MVYNKYLYALVDMSYLLSRNLFAASRGKNINEFTEGDVIRITLQTINKIPRDYGITCDKFIFLFDKWDKTLGGYYRTYLLKNYVTYKGSRRYMDEVLLEEIKSNPESTPEQIAAAELEYYTNQVKYKSKWGMIRDLKNFGIPCFGVDGWEFDDLAWLAGCMLYNKDNGKKSVIITKDSDLQYSLTPQMDYFRLPTGGSDPEVITYNQMYATIPDVLKEKGVSLYQYKAYLDSLGFGHNDMTKTAKSRVDPTNIICEVLNGDYTNVENVEAFTKQMESFDLSKFPRLAEAQEMIATELGTSGKIGTVEDFHKFCTKYKVTGISDAYFSELMGRFDEKLFSGK